MIPPPFPCRPLILGVVLPGLLSLGACANPSVPGTTPDGASVTTGEAAGSAVATPAPITLMLDYQPNTNHTGIYVAQAHGYFQAAGLAVTIIEPGEVYPEQALTTGVADFGISFQEALTLARAQGAPLVSLAAIIQHNSSAFAARGTLGVRSAADYAGRRYGGFGTPFEMPTLNALMACDAVARGMAQPPAAVEEINLGLSDPLALLAAEQIDLAWIFEGWQGMQARRSGLQLDLVRLADHQDCIPDYYTPILIGRQAMIDARPEVVRAFVAAVARGYADAIADPAVAAAELLKAVPELDAGLVRESQAWLSPRYQDDAPRWGQQRPEVWQGYADWLLAQAVLAAPLDTTLAFDNRFLP
ncbi:MAG: ABC transporter substrate-binding protein [Ardenticatenia bacterium]|nr:ABC transporter substrate-binding protein [Ardenticatenia bacterium]MBK8541900.1 ABC transporter substrate-binding protein [Ardenticatenia bacterium]